MIHSLMVSLVATRLTYGATPRLTRQDKAIETVMATESPNNPDDSSSKKELVEWMNRDWPIRAVILLQTWRFHQREQETWVVSMITPSTVWGLHVQGVVHTSLHHHFMWCLISHPPARLSFKVATDMCKAVLHQRLLIEGSSSKCSQHPQSSPSNFCQRMNLSLVIAMFRKAESMKARMLSWPRT